MELSGCQSNTNIRQTVDWIKSTFIDEDVWIYRALVCSYLQRGGAKQETDTPAPHRLRRGLAVQGAEHDRRQRHSAQRWEF